jgi:hypothetical protein
MFIPSHIHHTRTATVHHFQAVSLRFAGHTTSIFKGFLKIGEDGKNFFVVNKRSLSCIQKLPKRQWTLEVAQ